MFLLFFSVYILVPCLMSRLFRRHQADALLTYLLTAVIIFTYPFVFIWIRDLLNPPEPGPRCYTPEASLVMGSTIVLLPASLVIQLISNYFVFRYQGKEQES